MIVSGGLLLQRLLGGAFATEDGADGFEDDLDVERERPVLYVVEIQADHVLEREVLATADLPVAGHPRDGRESLFVQLAHLLKVMQGQRPRSHEAHFALEDVY